VAAGKLAELIRAVKGAGTGMVRLEEMTEPTGQQHDQTAGSECDTRGAQRARSGRTPGAAGAGQQLPNLRARVTR
jgi:hypothetical protein